MASEAPLKCWTDPRRRRKNTSKKVRSLLPGSWNSCCKGPTGNEREENSFSSYYDRALPRCSVGRSVGLAGWMATCACLRSVFMVPISGTRGLCLHPAPPERWNDLVLLFRCHCARHFSFRSRTSGAYLIFAVVVCKVIWILEADDRTGDWTSAITFRNGFN